ncbi:MAG TPA: cytochrome d ubiquinol oxidase subunit II, partial [Candidatus Methylacidiphilales bacterium]
MSLDMVTAWYDVVGFLLIVYVVLEGRNFGAGMLHWFVAKTPAERRQVVAAVGPLWSWHEVWLLSFGGTLLMAFPKLMASAFPGYYLALFLILWCFVLRGIALEVGGHLKDGLWTTFWDFVFAVSSTLLAILFGAAAGNLARGVPLDPQGEFSMAFFTDFGVHGVKGDVGLLDWYTLSVAAFAAVLLAAHGATYLAMKTDGPVHDRSAALARRLWAASIPVFAVVSVECVFVRPDLVAPMLGKPLVWCGVAVIVAAAAALLSGLLKGEAGERRAFAAGNVLIAACLATGAAAIFPEMLHSTLDPKDSMTAYAAAAGPH